MSERIVPDSFKGASDLLRRFIDQKQIAGGAIMAIQGGQVCCYDYAGYADIEKGLPMAHDTIYAIYSMSKVVTAVALLQLYEKGLFHMHQPVSDFLPGFADQMVAVERTPGKIDLEPAKTPVTMKHLLTMTSGIPYPDDSPIGREVGRVFQRADEQGLGTRDFCDAVGKAPLCFHPGQRYLYGFSSDILGGVLEAITGRRFGDYLAENIFGPLGMKDACFHLTPEQLARTATIYTPKEGGLVPAKDGRERPTQRPAFESGGGGLFMTTYDYARLGQMLLSGGTLDGQRILGRKTIELMTTDHLTPEQYQTFDMRHENQRGCSYGLSVRVRTSAAEAGLNISRGEFGWDGYAGTWFTADPREDLVLLFMIQRVPGGQDWMHYRMLTSLYAGI